jgi:hypothetical protein
MFHAPDPLELPGTRESPRQLLSRACGLIGTPGQAYVECRGIPAPLSHEAGVRYAPELAGRPAVIVPLYNRTGDLTSVHGRYIQTLRGQDKMLTIGRGDGAIGVLDGWRGDPLIIVEGLFDALSLAVCGYSSVATIGRSVSWLRDVAAGRLVWLAFDAGRPGDAEAARWSVELRGSELRRIPPPGRSKDWNSALVKSGRASVTRWLQHGLDQPARGGTKS